MKANLEQCYFWRRRSWGPGLTEIPDDLAAALGLTSAPAAAPTQSSALDEPPDDSDDDDAIPYALRLINGVDVVREIQVIPTIGAGAAKRLLENRPPGGYQSLDDCWTLNPELLSPPYRTDPDAIAVWGGD
jgi:hypothetical protein